MYCSQLLASTVVAHVDEGFCGIVKRNSAERVRFTAEALEVDIFIYRVADHLKSASSHCSFPQLHC